MCFMEVSNQPSITEVGERNFSMKVVSRKLVKLRKCMPNHLPPISFLFFNNRGHPPIFQSKRTVLNIYTILKRHVNHDRPTILGAKMRSLTHCLTCDLLLTFSVVKYE